MKLWIILQNVIGYIIVLVKFLDSLSRKYGASTCLLKEAHQWIQILVLRCIVKVSITPFVASQLKGIFILLRTFSCVKERAHLYVLARH